MEAQEKQHLTGQQQSIAAISALTATGDLKNLKSELDSGLEAGLTVNEIKEILVQLYAYCGFPRSLNALNTFKTVADERKTKGITDKTGKEIVVENNVVDKYEQGRKVLEVLTKTPQSKPAPGFGEFSPRIDSFLKEHLFADVFASDVLTYQQRELATISALAAMPGLASQLESHIGIGMNTGITEQQIKTVFDIIENSINKEQAEKARDVLAKMKK
ncbi:carboxymuconolactone decarboxylase family protein [Pedobacter sp.]|uniref:carboxymuconolactone decarboxylase family protein n=1 Tax=Pedobacter sp. TaxID=1411316 RepID=UPI002B950D8A|nr:carboxymuconolactone decarboxylase family protein [Pedobacter sp.]HWW38042.1 carboxymuconolactone decarboxylase family protein [Pedobacter sp.]